MRLKAPNVLLLNKNVIELKRHLEHVLTKKSVRDLDADIAKNVAELFSLGEDHFQFCCSLQAKYWRQTISRAYYSAYGVSRSVRLAAKGYYTQEAKDHDKVGDLPDDFPKKSTYSNKLGLLRDDRNLCDYDHTATESDLSENPMDTISMVTDFIADARAYLAAKKFHV